MKAKKVLLGLVAMGLTAVVAVGGTLAFLSSQSQDMVNTFTIGNGYEEDDEDHTGIYVDEEDVTPEDDEDGDGRTEGEQEYPDLLPGTTYVKDPTVHLVANSVNSYVFVEVTGVDAAEELGLHIDGINEAWVKVSGGTGVDGIYVYAGAQAEDHVVAIGEEEVTLESIFDSITLDAGLTNDQFDAAVEGFETNGTAIVVRACAVQDPNVEYADALAAAVDMFANN